MTVRKTLRIKSVVYLLSQEALPASVEVIPIALLLLDIFWTLLLGKKGEMWLFNSCEQRSLL